MKSKGQYQVFNCRTHKTHLIFSIVEAAAAITAVSPRQCQRCFIHCLLTSQSLPSSPIITYHSPSALLTDYKLAVGSEEVILPGISGEEVLSANADSPYDPVYSTPPSTSRLVTLIDFNKLPVHIIISIILIFLSDVPEHERLFTIVGISTSLCI